MAALLYEMVWVRLLVNFLGSSTYAFSIMLAAFISGITIGSFIVTKKFVKKFNRIKLLIFCQTAIATGIFFSLVIYERLPYYFWKIASWFEKSDTTFNIFLSAEFLICFCLMFAPTIFMGMTLPTVVDIVAQSNKKIGLSVGRVFSVNTIGTVVGVFLTTLVLIPLLGIKDTFEFGIGLNLLIAFVLLQNYDPIGFAYKTSISVTFIILFLIYIMFSPVWNLNIMNSGVFRSFSAPPPDSFSEFENLYISKKVLYYKEGINANVAVIQADSMGQKTLIINGKADATNKVDMATQVM
ncbi:MAG: fused MFS/spermidine synthase [Ignavibacteriaceae bacterium]|jgi:spermidine synthase